MYLYSGRWIYSIPRHRISSRHYPILSSSLCISFRGFFHVFSTEFPLLFTFHMPRPSHLVRPNNICWWYRS
jgi:hypothetical protein